MCECDGRRAMMSRDIVRNIIVILAAGSGSRFQSDVPKQYVLINGRELLWYSVTELKKSRDADRLIIVTDEKSQHAARLREEYGCEVILGGCDRAHSFGNALDYITNNYPECEKVIFHEAARPLITYDLVDRYFGLLDDYDRVETCKHITDSLGSFTETLPKREDYYLIQAPEAYRFQMLHNYYDRESDIYYAGNQFPDTVRKFQYFLDEPNFKVTTPSDKRIVEVLLEERYGKG